MGAPIKHILDPEQVQELLNEHHGNLARVSKALGVSRSTLDNQIRTGIIDVDVSGPRQSLCDQSKRKFSDQVGSDGSLEDRDLKNADKLLEEYDVSSDDYEIVKIDVAKRDAGTASSPKVSRSISVTVAPKGEQLQPALKGEKTVFKSRPPKKKESKDGSKLFVVLGDEQAPSGLDEDLHEKVCQFLRDVKPDEVVHIGDLGDFESVSAYQQLNPDTWGNSVQDCINSSYEILGNYRASVPKETRFRYLIGNHEVRLQKYLLSQAKEIYGITQADGGPSVLDLAYLLRLEELDIELVRDDLGTYPHPQIELVPDKLLAMHGDKARKGAGNTPHAMSDGTSYGVIHGHTHRAAVVSRTIRGTSKRQQLQSAEIGCLCTPNGLGYTSARSTDWQQGFATVEAWKDGHYHIDLASYQNGVLVWRGERW